MQTRNIVLIDEDKCDGCGLCVPACAEGAIQIVNGKARLVSDRYCDGLGACLGHCPRGAISIIERVAEAFNEAAVARHKTTKKTPEVTIPVAARRSLPAASHGGGCPGAMAKHLRPDLARPASVRDARLPVDDTRADAHTSAEAEEGETSRLANWPVQLHLVPPHAPYLQGADLLLAADCVPFAYAQFHRRFLDGRPVLIGCPKLDDAQSYVQKLAQIIRTAHIRSITVVHMEVPCCSGIVRIAQAAIEAAATDIPLEDVTISIRGEELAPAHAL